MNILKLFRRLKPQPLDRTLGRIEIIISGSGGQGMILAGKILAEAAAIYDNKEAIMSQSYGPEARGGASRAEIIISSEPINYPKVMQTNILLVMTQEAMDKYGEELKPQGLLIVNETLVTSIPRQFKNVFKAPFTSLAVNELKAQIVANVIALGTLAELTGVVSRESLTKAVIDMVPKKALALDKLAVDLGFKLAAQSSFKWEK
jgi:2-oxoglutarate ferredoxin oxidoreductase subunit gamma